MPFAVSTPGHTVQVPEAHREIGIFSATTLKIFIINAAVHVAVNLTLVVKEQFISRRIVDILKTTYVTDRGLVQTALWT